MATKAAGAKAPEYPFTFQLADFQKYLLMFPHLQALAARAALGQQQQALSFLTHRCEQDVQLVDRIVNAGEIKDIYDAVVNFYEGAAKEYAAEAGKVAELGSRMTDDAMKSMRQETDEMAQQAMKMSEAA